MGWYPARAALWAYGFEKPVSVSAHAGRPFTACPLCYSLPLEAALQGFVGSGGRSKSRLPTCLFVWLCAVTKVGERGPSLLCTRAVAPAAAAVLVSTSSSSNISQQQLDSFGALCLSFRCNHAVLGSIQAGTSLPGARWCAPCGQSEAEAASMLRRCDSLMLAACLSQVHEHGIADRVLR